MLEPEPKTFPSAQARSKADIAMSSKSDSRSRAAGGKKPMPMRCSTFALPEPTINGLNTGLPKIDRHFQSHPLQEGRARYPHRALPAQTMDGVISTLLSKLLLRLFCSRALVQAGFGQFSQLFIC